MEKNTEVLTKDGKEWTPADAEERTNLIQRGWKTKAAAPAKAADTPK